MFLPLCADCLNIEQPVALQAFDGQQVLSPLPQLSSEPAIDRDAKAHLGSLNQGGGDVLIEHLAKCPFAFAVTYLEAHGQPPGKLHYSMVKNRHSRLKA